MATNPRDLASNQQHSTLLLMSQPVEIRLYIYELAFRDILAYIESFASSPTSVYGVTVKVQGALAFLLASKATRAEFSEGVLPLLAAHCEDFGPHVKKLELDWDMKLIVSPHFQPGQTTLGMFAYCLAFWRLNMQRDREVANAQITLQALSTVKHIVERIARQSKPKLKSSSDLEDESSQTDA